MRKLGTDKVEDKLNYEIEIKDNSRNVRLYASSRICEN